MKLDKAIKLLELHNTWRRGDDSITMVHPTDLGKAIDVIVNHYKAEQLTIRDRCPYCIRLSREVGEHPIGILEIVKKPSLTI